MAIAVDVVDEAKEVVATIALAIDSPTKSRNPSQLLCLANATSVISRGIRDQSAGS